MIGPATAQTAVLSPERFAQADSFDEVIPSGTCRLAVRVAGVLTIAVCAIAVLVRLTCAGAARRWLTFGFHGVPATPAMAGAIFLHNLHALAAVAGLLLIAQSPHWAGRDRRGVHRALQRGGEVLLGAGVAVNVIVIGAAFGAYGIRMVRAALPHGPVELAAYSIALASYVRGRRVPLSARELLCTYALAVMALAAASVLETFVDV